MWLERVFFTIVLPTMLKCDRSLAVLRRIISRLSKISSIWPEEKTSSELYLARRNRSVQSTERRAPAYLSLLRLVSL